eukprot:15261310-Heterocapsa_arctica.AAC.1
MPVWAPVAEGGGPPWGGAPTGGWDIYTDGSGGKPDEQMGVCGGKLGLGKSKGGKKGGKGKGKKGGGKKGRGEGQVAPQMAGWGAA